jgi:8-oxo-dGTP diphosphatase
MSEAQRPKVGVGVVIHDGSGNIIMGERAGSHGAGEYGRTLSYDVLSL